MPADPRSVAEMLQRLEMLLNEALVLAIDLKQDYGRVPNIAKRTMVGDKYIRVEIGHQEDFCREDEFLPKDASASM